MIIKFPDVLKVALCIALGLVCIPTHWVCATLLFGLAVIVFYFSSFPDTP